MKTLQQITLFLHLLAAVAWIGGTLFLTMVGPALRKLDFANANLYMRTMNRSFKIASWHAVALVVLTGVANVYFQGGFDDLLAYLKARPAMHAKLTAVIAMIVIKYVHDFVTGPRAAAAAAESTAIPDRPSGAWKATMALARVNLVLGILVLYLAVLLR